MSISPPRVLGTVLLAGLALFATAAPHACPLARSAEAGGAPTAAASHCPNAPTPSDAPQDSGAAHDGLACAMACGALAMSAAALPPFSIAPLIATTPLVEAASPPPHARLVDHVPLRLLPA